MRYLLLLLMILLASCKKDESKWNKPRVEAKLTAEVMKPISDAEAARNAAAYQKSLAFTPKSLSEIDRLTTEEEVENLIHRLDTNYRLFEVKAISEFNRGYTNDSILKLSARKLGVRKSFYKYDLDGNGYTDVVVFGDDHHCTTANDAGIEITCDYTCLAIMGSAGGPQLKVLNSRRFSESVVPEIVPWPGGRSLIRMHDKERKLLRNILMKDSSTVTLTYLKDAFVEHNPKPVFRGIEKIEYYTTFCFGTCPVFQLTLNEDKSAYFIAKEFNFHNDMDDVREEEEGFFKGIITPEKYNEITALLTYMDFESLNDFYHVSATDQPTSTLRITYDNGQIKEIGDYGMEGTYGLQKLYDLLAALRFNQKWVKTEEVYGVRIKTPYDL